MNIKFLFPIFCAAKLFSSTPTPLDSHIKDLYDVLSYQNIMCTNGDISENFKFYNYEALGLFVQGTDSFLQILVKGLKPHCIFNKPVYLQSLPKDVKSKFLELPNLPNEIRKTKENLCVHVFAYAAEAFGKECDPFFIYLGRTVTEGEIATPLTMADFDYTDSLTWYRQLCSMIKQLPMDSITPEKEKFLQLKKLAMIGIIEAQFKCGAMLLKKKNIPDNEAKAFRFLKLAADQGHKEAQFKCGFMLHQEIGVKQDKAEALKYLKSAADHGLKEAQFYYGIMLLNQKDILEALKYFKLAADQGHAKAQYNCGAMLLYGAGVEQNKAEALKYLKSAADQGHAKALQEYSKALENAQTSFCTDGWH